MTSSNGTSVNADHVGSPRIRWPRTHRGWRRLFWLTIHRCPIHKAPLYDDAAYMPVPLACHVCDDVGLWPRGALDALRQNHAGWMRERMDGKPPTTPACPSDGAVDRGVAGIGDLSRSP